MNIKIQNESQLLTVIDLIMRGVIPASKAFTEELTFSFSFSQVIKEIDSDKQFFMLMPASKRSQFIDFENVDGTVEFTFYLRDSRIIIINENRDLDSIYSIDNEFNYKKLEERYVNGVIEDNHAKSVFLELSSFDYLGGGVRQDVYETYAKKDENIHFAVFGYYFKK